MARVLITGASGFVGAALLRRMNARGAFRVAKGIPGSGVVVGEINGQTDWRAALTDIDVVVHLAARAHVVDERESDPLSFYRRVNVVGSVHLAQQALDAGVRRFIYMSSIKVNGESTPPGRPFTAADEPAPVGPYGVSKMEAELALQSLTRGRAMDLVIIRPPLVYGPGVKANFRSLLSWLERGIPLPFGGVNNRRSLVSIDNLIDLVETCVVHPRSAGCTFLVSDGDDMSTETLLRRAAHALGRKARLFYVPNAALMRVAALAGQGDTLLRLCSSLIVDIEPTRRLLGWSPRVGVDEALQSTARHFLGGMK